MKPLRSILLSLALFAVVSLAPRAAQAQVSFNFFYGSLSPRGAWVRVSDYGYCWHPAGVSEAWRPYTDGYWAYTDAGWTWVSYEDWGGITYHYGRWTFVDGYGWVWVPGYHWGPAWVSWRRSDDYVGWAPLPPECHFHPGVTIGFSVDSSCGIGPGWYNFCAFHDFGAPALGAVILDPSRNVTIINSTVNITNITSSNGRVRNGGPSLAFVSQRTAQPIQRLALVRNSSPGANGFQSVSAGRLQLADPAIVPSPGAKPASVARVFSKPTINHGWSGIPIATRKSLRTQFSHEKGVQSLAAIRKTQGPAPASPAVKKNTVLQPFHPATAQSSEKIETRKKTEHLEAVAVPKKTALAVPKKTVLAKPANLETYHAPKPPKPPKEEYAGSPLKLKIPPSQPKVSKAGSGPKKGEKKDDKKKDAQGQ